MKNSKGFIQIILVLVVIALVGGGMYYFGTLKNKSNIVIETPTEEPVAQETQKPSADPTAGWEVYVNKEYGYSLRYPGEMYIRLICTGEELTVTTRTEKNKRSSPVVVGECNRGGKYELETVTHPTIQPDLEETKYYNIIKKDIKIDDISGKIYLYTFTNIEEGPFPKSFAIARVNKNNKTYEIYFGDINKLDLFYQILSTFKFTK